MKLIQKAAAVALSPALAVSMMPAVALATTAQEAADAEQAFTNESLKTYTVQEVADGQAFSDGLTESQLQLMGEENEEGATGAEPSGATGKSSSATTEKTEPTAKPEKVEAGKVKKLKGTFTFTVKGTSVRMGIAGGTMKTGKQSTLGSSTGRTARFFRRRV